jgi:hypothetical protein
MLRGRERLTSLRLAPIALCNPPLENPTLASSQIRFSEHPGRRRRSLVEDHLHSGVRLVRLAQMLIEHPSITPHDDEPARQWRLVSH